MCMRSEFIVLNRKWHEERQPQNSQDETLRERKERIISKECESVTGDKKEEEPAVKH